MRLFGWFRGPKLRWDDNSRTYRDSDGRHYTECFWGYMLTEAPPPTPEQNLKLLEMLRKALDDQPDL